MKNLLLKNRKRFVLYIIGALLASTTSIMQTLALSEGFSMIETSDKAELIEKAIKIVILGFAPVIIQVISRYMRIGFMRDVLIDVRTLTYKKIMSIPIEQFRSKKREDYISMLASDINIFERDFFLSILNIIYSAGSFLMGIAILIFIHPLIALMVVLASISLFIIVKVFENPTIKARRLNQTANAEYTSKASNMLNGLEVIKLYQVEDNFKPPFYFIVEKLERIKLKVNLLNQMQWNLSMWVSQVFQFVIYILATYLYINDSIQLVGLILVFNSVGSLVWGSISGFNFVNRLKGSVDIFNKITETSQYESGTETFKLNQSIVLKNVSYSYVPEKVILDNLSFEIKKGSKVLIYGPSGTGKTTLANCLSQNLSGYEGSILFDGVEVRDIHHESFLKACGYIRQHHFMFEDSIKNNIVLDQEYDEDKLKDILKSVDLLTWVENLPEGVDYKLLKNGSNVSGGQKQRLSIARELYRDSQVLFIDEPSASLDDESSLAVYNTILNLDKTVVIISHRHLDYLSSKVDNIVIFKEEGGYIYEEK